MAQRATGAEQSGGLPPGLGGGALGLPAAVDAGASKPAASRPDFAVCERGSARFIKTRLQNGRPIWVKYPFERKKRRKPFFGAWPPPQNLAAKILPARAARVFLPIMPPLPAASRTAPEIAKLRRFKAAHLPAAEILAAHGGFAVFAECGEAVEDILPELRRRNKSLHDGLLVRCAEALGRIHAAGFCLGRPDLGNLFLTPAGVGVSGFRDYPETCLPPAAAQARDIWQMLALLAAEAADKDTVLPAAFRAWRRQAGLESLEDLRAGVRIFRRFLKPCRLLAPFLPRRLLRGHLPALRFLAANLGI